jgi:hypothetical protein
MGILLSFIESAARAVRSRAVVQGRAVFSMRQRLSPTVGLLSRPPAWPGASGGMASASLQARGLAR